MKLNLQPNLSVENYPKWAEILEESGVCTDTIPNSFLETRLRMRMSVHGFDNFYHYYNYLKSLNRNNREWRVLIDSLTVKETRFFRDPDSLFLIEKFLLSNQRLPGKSQRSIHAWSVACATGEEAYSLAIIIDKIPGKLKIYFSESQLPILATLRSPRESKVYIMRAG